MIVNLYYKTFDNLCYVGTVGVFFKKQQSPVAYLSTTAVL